LEDPSASASASASSFSMNDDPSEAIGWEKPSWTKGVKLKSSIRGQAVKQGGALEAPITQLPALRKQLREQSEHEDEEDSSSHQDHSWSSEKDPEWVKPVLHHSPQKPKPKYHSPKPKWANATNSRRDREQPDDLDFNNSAHSSSQNSYSQNSEPEWARASLNKSPQKTKPKYQFEKPEWAQGGVALKKGASPKKSPVPHLSSPGQTILKKSPSPLPPPSDHVGNSSETNMNRWGDKEEEKRQRFPGVMAPPLSDDDDDDNNNNDIRNRNKNRKKKKKQDEPPILRLKPTAKPKKVHERDKNSYYKLRKVKGRHPVKQDQEQEVVQLKKVRFDDNLNMTRTLDDAEDDHNDKYYKLQQSKEATASSSAAASPHDEANDTESEPVDDDDDESTVHLQKLPHQDESESSSSTLQSSASSLSSPSAHDDVNKKQPPAANQPPMVVLDENGISPDDMYVVLKVKLSKKTAPNSKKAKKEVVRALRGIQVTVEENVEQPPDDMNNNLGHQDDPDHPLRGEPVIRLKKIPKTTESKGRARRNNNRGFYHMRKKKSKKKQPPKPMTTLPTLTEADEEEEYEETLQLQKVDASNDDEEHHDKLPEERDDLSYYYEFLNRTTRPPNIDEDEEDDIVQLQEVNIPGHGTKQHAPLEDENGISTNASYVLVKIKLKKLASQPTPPASQPPVVERPKLRPTPAPLERKKDSTIEKPRLKPTPPRKDDKETIDARASRREMRRTRPSLYDNDSGSDEAGNTQKQQREAEDDSPAIPYGNVMEDNQRRASLYDNDEEDDHRIRAGHGGAENDSNSGTSSVPLRHVEIKQDRTPSDIIEDSPLTRPDDSDSQSVSSLYEEEDDRHHQGNDVGEISSESLRRGPTNWRDGDEDETEQRSRKLKSAQPSKKTSEPHQSEVLNLRQAGRCDEQQEPSKRDTARLRHVNRAEQGPEGTQPQSHKLRPTKPANEKDGDEVSYSEDDSESTGFEIPQEPTPITRKQLSPDEEAGKRREREQAAKEKHNARMQRVREREEQKALANYSLDEANKQREKCYIWYSRLGQPNKRKMKELVAKLPPSCDITVEEIDFLPWLPGDYVCDVRQMTKLITSDELTALVKKNQSRPKNSGSESDSE